MRAWKWQIERLGVVKRRSFLSSPFGMSESWEDEGSLAGLERVKESVGWSRPSSFTGKETGSPVLQNKSPSTTLSSCAPTKKTSGQVQMICYHPWNQRNLQQRTHISDGPFIWVLCWRFLGETPSPPAPTEGSSTSQYLEQGAAQVHHRTIIQLLSPIGAWWQTLSLVSCIGRL